MIFLITLLEEETKQRPKTKDTNEEVKAEVNKEIYQIYKQSAPSWE